MTRMNWGSGGDLRPDWVNVDVCNYEDRAVCHDILESPLPFPTGTFELVVANHSIQQIPWDRLSGALSEFHRILAPGGVLRCIVPNIEEGFRAYARLDRSWFPNQEEETTAEAFSRWITWGGQNQTCFTAESLYWCLTKAGFRAEPVSFGDTLSLVDGACDLDSREHESLFMEGIA